MKTASHASQVRTKSALFSQRFCAVKEKVFPLFFPPCPKQITHSCPSVLFLVSLQTISDHTWCFRPTVFFCYQSLEKKKKKGALMYRYDDPGVTQLLLVVTWQWWNLGVTFLQEAVACVRSWVRFLEEPLCQPVFRGCINCNRFLDNSQTGKQ